jgi:hypothetical protein
MILFAIAAVLIMAVWLDIKSRGGEDDPFRKGDNDES